MRTLVFLSTAASLLAAQDAPKRIEPISVRTKRALVIGNAAYARSPLSSPVKDAEAMSAVLRDLGFTVTQAVNLNRRGMTEQIGRFSAQVQTGDLALFYFSGHGVRVGPESYLVPVDYAGASEADVEFDTYPVDKVRAKLEERGARLRILLLDACRDNPYSTRKGVGQGGLAAPVLQAEGTFVGFATGANNTASDSPGLGNSLYTKNLIDALRMPGLTLQEVFSRVKETVYAASGGKQNPAYYDEVVGRFWFVPLAAAIPVALHTGQAKVNPKDGQTYVWIEPGTFTMGCSPGDTECAPAEKPPRQVTISRGFWMGQTDVTHEVWQQIMGTDPTVFSGPKLPVDKVNWNESQNYCQTVGMRLPTDAEWEYAARAGNTLSRYGEVDRIAWYEANSDHRPHEVMKKEPNAWGLYDMLGNVWQWTADWYEEGKSRTHRGGAWESPPSRQRVSVRLAEAPGNRVFGIGFRCAGDQLP